MKKRRPCYPGDDTKPAPLPPVLDEEPDILETAGGFSPNYDKLTARGMTPEEALAWCNMD